MPRIDVAIAIIFKAERLLICRRKADAALGGLWEFPGGKFEPGESAQACLRREVLEETGLEVGVEQELPQFEYIYGHATVRLHPFICTYVSGEAQALAADEVRWVAALELPEYRFPPANDQILPQVLSWLRSNRTS
jgi:mutator protein MutT